MAARLCDNCHQLATLATVPFGIASLYAAVFVLSLVVAGLLIDFFSSPRPSTSTPGSWSTSAWPGR